MRTFSIIKSIAIFLFFISSVFLNGQDLKHNLFFKSVELQTDYLENPIGIDNPNPRLSWRIDDNKGEANQYAYRLIVGTELEKINSISSITPVSGSFSGISWDTGKVKSDIQLVSY